MDKKIIKYIKWGAIAFALFIVGSCSLETVDSGHVKVGKMFGKVSDKALEEGLHLVNPFMSWTAFDARQKSIKISAEVPSRDQLTTAFELSVQFRMKKEMAPFVLKETGTLENTINIHMIPRIRSLIREEGKGVKNAEDFFKDEIQRSLQKNLFERLHEAVSSKGLEIQAILIRDVNLPKFIRMAIEQKKQREQDAQKEVAELKRFKTEQEKKEASANADFNAEKIKAKSVKVAADAQAYANRKLASSLTPTLLENKRIDKWDGVLSKFMGSGTPLINFK